MDVADWRSLCEVDFPLLEALHGVFRTPQALDCAFDDLEGAEDLVRLALGASATEQHVLRGGQQLLEWKRSSSLTLKRARKAEVDGCWFRPPVVQSDVVSASEVYACCISSSLELGLEALEKSLTKRRALQNKDSRKQIEDKLRRRWALVLANFIMEARLPAASAIEGMKDPQSAWGRAFGSRRANTLKNRALAWTKVHVWMVATFGRGWPLSAGELLCYLDERHEIQPMGKTGRSLEEQRAQRAVHFRDMLRCCINVSSVPSICGLSDLLSFEVR